MFLQWTLENLGNLEQCGPGSPPLRVSAGAHKFQVGYNAGTWDIEIFWLYCSNIQGSCLVGMIQVWRFRVHRSRVAWEGLIHHCLSWTEEYLLSRTWFNHTHLNIFTSICLDLIHPREVLVRIFVELMKPTLGSRVSGSWENQRAAR